MKRLLPVMFFAAMFAVSCETTNEPERRNLKVDSESLSFATNDNESQIVTVTAENVDWKHEVVAPADQWLTVSRDADRLTVSVSDNGEAGPRSGVIKVRPVDAPSVKSVDINVRQDGTDALIAGYGIALDKSELTFGGEDEKAQEVTVSVTGDDLTWSLKVAPLGKEWITADIQGDKIVVSVAQNPTYKVREAKITVVPGIEGVEEASFMVRQTESTIEPYIKPQKTELHFGYNDKETQEVIVETFGTSWTAALVADGGGDVWWSASPFPNENRLVVGAHRNKTTEERKGYIELSGAGVEPVRITVIQEAGVPTDSSLEGDVVFDNEDYAILWVEGDQADTQNYTYWTVELWSGDITKTQGVYGGTGEVVRLYLYSERVYEYESLPTVTYNVVNNWQIDAMSGNILSELPAVKPGELSTFGDRPLYSWYMRYENGEQAEAAPLTGGSVTVAQEGGAYTFTLALTDDINNSITGTVDVAFDEYTINKNDI